MSKLLIECDITKYNKSLYEDSNLYKKLYHNYKTKVSTNIVKTSTIPLSDIESKLDLKYFFDTYEYFQFIKIPDCVIKLTKYSDYFDIFKKNINLFHFIPKEFDIKTWEELYLCVYSYKWFIFDELLLFSMNLNECSYRYPIYYSNFYIINKLNSFGIPITKKTFSISCEYNNIEIINYLINLNKSIMNEDLLFFSIKKNDLVFFHKNYNFMSKVIIDFTLSSSLITEIFNHKNDSFKLSLSTLVLTNDSIIKIMLMSCVKRDSYVFESFYSKHKNIINDNIICKIIENDFVNAFSLILNDHKNYIFNKKFYNVFFQQGKYSFLCLNFLIKKCDIVKVEEIKTAAYNNNCKEVVEKLEKVIFDIHKKNKFSISKLTFSIITVEKFQELEVYGIKECLINSYGTYDIENIVVKKIISSGNLELFKYINKKYRINLNCIEHARDLKMLNYLLSIGYVITNTFIMSSVTALNNKYVQPEVLNFIVKKGFITKNTNFYNNLLEKSCGLHLKKVQILAQNNDYNFTLECFNNAILNKKYDIINYLYIKECPYTDSNIKDIKILWKDLIIKDDVKNLKKMKDLRLGFDEEISDFAIRSCSRCLLLMYDLSFPFTHKQYDKIYKLKNGIIDNKSVKK